MKIPIRCPPWRTMLNSLLLGLLLAIVAAPAAAGVCDVNPNHHKCTGGGDDGNDGQYELTIQYEFGELTGTDCAYPQCVVSTVTAIGTRHCDQHGHCNFNGSIPEEEAPFLLPRQTLLDLFEGQYWKDVELDPEACFQNLNFPYETDLMADPSGRGVELARHIVDDGWFTAIGAWALDVDAANVRKYVFYFTGCDDPDPVCGLWEPYSMLGDYYGGELLRIEVPPKDKKLKSTPCRCTISNEPDGCPGAVSVPMRVFVLDETPL